MSPSYVLALAAEADLRDVVRYTRKKWGDAQARIYLATLKGCIDGVAIGHSLFKDMTGLYPGLRMVHCEHHYIFCLPRDGAPALVVAIFHERMDLMARLADRLK